ncbi:MAG: BMP family ABC transporter substrate-binding protein [Treponema sp.]|nr:BMP family ABC transporter substrate-binding protein [Treponema sp.]
MKNRKTSLILSFAAALTVLFSGCSGKKESNALSIAVFVPGIMADSPTYANLAKGVQAGIDEYNAGITDESKKAKVYIMEAGTNQAEWSTKLTALAADGSYGAIISSNPSIPELAQEIVKQFPEQKFVLLDGTLDGNQNIACISYDQKEQTYLSGYISGLLSKSHKVAVVAAQEYPVMNNVLYPYYALGASDAVAGTTCDFRVVGNWYDGTKGAEITDALVQAGVDVIMPICGGAAQGVISSAKENGILLSFIDENSFAKAPGTVISSCSTEQALASKEATLAYLNGKTEWGKTKTVGIKEGYIKFIQDDPLYVSNVPEEVRNTMSSLVKQLTDGTKEIPQL